MVRSGLLFAGVLALAAARGAVADCALLCSRLESANCIGSAATASYTTNTSCLSVCQNANWPAGTPGTFNGNTLACRETHAQVMGPNVCANAGFSGGGVCGSLAENLCDQLEQCSPNLLGNLTRQACLQSASRLPQGAAQTATTPTSGNSLNCRLHQAMLALEAGTQDVCDAFHLASDGTCGTMAEAYCSVATQVCPFNNNTYADGWTDETECLAFTAGNVPPIPSGNFTSPSNSNTLECRTRHAFMAAANNNARNANCPNALRNGGGVCGSLCNVHCSLYLANCPANPSFTTQAQCEQACTLLIPGGPNDASGNNVGCRIRYASQAGITPSTSTSSCARAIPTNDALLPCAFQTVPTSTSTTGVRFIVPDQGAAITAGAEALTGASAVALIAAAAALF